MKNLLKWLPTTPFTVRINPVTMDERTKSRLKVTRVMGKKRGYCRAEPS